MQRLPEKFPVLEITTTIGCKLNCRYCPQEVLLRAYKARGGKETKLSLLNFKKCLEKVMPGGSLSFSGMAEPFQNEACTEMIRYAFAQGFKISLFTTLYGMTENHFMQLKDVVFSNFILHIPDAEGNSHFEISPAYLSLFKKVVSHFEINYYSCHGTVHPSISTLLRQKIPIASKMTNRSGHLKHAELETYDYKGKIRCIGGIRGKQSVGYVPVLLPDGTLAGCCNDYGLNLVIGNLFSQSCEDIYRGDSYRQLEQSFDNDTLPSPCRHCHRAAPIEIAQHKSCNQMANNAVKVGRMLETFGTIRECTLNLSKQQKSLLQQIIQAKTICIFGLGSLFQSTYFVNGWNYVLKAALFCDNNPVHWEKRYHGILCVSPDKLKIYKGLVIIIYVSNPQEIINQLQFLGSNPPISISIFDIFNLPDA